MTTTKQKTVIQSHLWNIIVDVSWANILYRVLFGFVLVSLFSCQKNDSRKFMFSEIVESVAFELFTENELKMSNSSVEIYNDVNLSNDELSFFISEFEPYLKKELLPISLSKKIISNTENLFIIDKDDLNDDIKGRLSIVDESILTLAFSNYIVNDGVISFYVSANFNKNNIYYSRVVILSYFNDKICTSIPICTHGNPPGVKLTNMYLPPEDLEVPATIIRSKPLVK